MKGLIAKKAFLLIALFSLVSCKGIISDHNLSIETNQIISTTTFAEKFGLPLSGNFPFTIKEVNYGNVDLAAKTDVDDFTIRVTADLSAFNSEIWQGFGPISALPNGSAFPSWVAVTKLIQIFIPTFTELFSSSLLVAKKDNRLYIGIDLKIQSVDQYYPEGLNISQEVKNKESSYPFASIYAYGPQYDESGNKISNSGVTILSSFSL